MEILLIIMASVGFTLFIAVLAVERYVYLSRMFYLYCEDKESWQPGDEFSFIVCSLRAEYMEFFSHKFRGAFFAPFNFFASLLVIAWALYRMVFGYKVLLLDDHFEP